MWRISYEKVMSETPIGPVENRVMCIEFDGRKYHQVDINSHDFIDIESGEVVQIKIVDWVPQIVGK